MPDDLGPGTYVFRADAVDVAGNAASTTRRADGTEMAVRKVAAAPRCAAKRRRAGRRGEDADLRAAALAPAPRHRADGALRRRRGGAQRPPARRRRRRYAGSQLRVVSRPSRGALGGARAETVGTGPHGGFGSRYRRAPRGGSRSPSPATPASTGEPPAADAAGARRRQSQRAPRALRTGQVGAPQRPGRAAAARRCRVAASWSRSSTSSRRRSAGARSWSPAATTAVASTPAIASATSAARALIRLRAVALAEERWPYAPGASRPVTVRVTGR